MLDIATNHIEEVKHKMKKIWFQDKYKYYNYDEYYREIDIVDETWNTHQFVSLDMGGNVIGYIDYQVNRQTYNCHNLGINNFSDNKITFGMDVGQVIADIFEKFKFNKLTFSVVVGNPIWCINMVVGSSVFMRKRRS